MTTADDENGSGNATVAADPITKLREYRALVQRTRELLGRALPFGANVLVVSKGDDELLNLDGRRASHFPQGENGGYAGYYPASGDDAVEHLEALRSQGAEFLALPSTALWWLEHYPELAAHLEARYERVIDHRETCVAFALGDAVARDASLERAPTHAPDDACQLRELIGSVLPDTARVAILAQPGERPADRSRHAWWPRTPPLAPGLDRGAFERDLDALEAGTDFLVVPAGALEDRTARDLSHLLQRRYRVVLSQRDVCSIFELGGRPDHPRNAATGGLLVAEHAADLARSLLPPGASVVVVGPEREELELLDDGPGDGGAFLIVASSEASSPREAALDERHRQIWRDRLCRIYQIEPSPEADNS